VKSSYLVLLSALSVAAACDKSETSGSTANKAPSTAATGEAAKSDTKPAEPEAKKEPAKPPLLDRLSDFAGRAEKSNDSMPDIVKLIEEGEALMNEVQSSDDEDIVMKEPVKNAMAQLKALGTKRTFLNCAAKDTEKDVSTCVDEIFNDSVHQVLWDAEVRQCQQYVELRLEYGAEKIAESDVCKATAPSFEPQFKMVHEKSAALAEVDEKKWLKARNKVLAGAWNTFSKRDVAKNYWKAVGDSLHKYCSGVEDGELDVPSIFLVDNVLKALGGKDALGKLPTTSYKKLVKDRNAEKGKVMTVRAKVLSISKDGDFYRGQLADSSFRSYMFVTSGSTDDIFEDSSVELRGVVSQIEQFETRGGGTNAAPVIIGFLAKPGRRSSGQSTRSCYPAGTSCEQLPSEPVSCYKCCSGAWRRQGYAGWECL